MKTVYDFGDIIIQLDFLTHQDTFIMTNISSPQETSMKLSDLFNAGIGGRAGEKQITQFPVARVKQNQSQGAQFFRRNQTPEQTNFSTIIQMKGGEEYDNFL